ncbi:Cys-tRNA(Pro) deacylase [Altericroceibacterium spongiae]|uniref:Cys-tRNA(Pro)/Cys-tRNA(Cys) deacylase n=1 Tax=Altericroceibacterium spongiae TaxID=2320269 RepID=A0A420EIG1_9SPHN|nr:Cys-tRNA(Pro) deacylase [Altericroceibacterium spongiae]RKF20511.1 Cys-tRNA(Pro) deacylase [Altericroceibacterium spongiae]
MSVGTPATQFLRKADIAFEPVQYDYHPGQERVALQAAEAVGIAPDHLLKTLMLEVDGHPACVVVPGDRTVSMKRAAAAFGGKSASMMPSDKAERITGYRTGGISPFGQKRKVPVIFESTAMAFTQVGINGGKRGLILLLSPEAARAALDARALPLCAEN